MRHSVVHAGSSRGQHAAELPCKEDESRRDASQREGGSPHEIRRVDVLHRLFDGAGGAAVALEERGFDIVWAPEHSHIPLSRKTSFLFGGELPKHYYDVMDPFVTLTAAAMATRTLKVGTGVCLVAQRDPIQTAKLVASIDQVSRGRFVFGVGNGWNRDEMENHGTDFETRHKRAQENIEAMKEIWAVRPAGRFSCG
jgi:alkanesulfonate monooxygenase SsuD/methylene tetrahydromethanopterin reductase-like flavin-dependent oxidoreductase (luciferase family)